MSAYLVGFIFPQQIFYRKIKTKQEQIFFKLKCNRIDEQNKQNKTKKPKKINEIVKIVFFKTKQRRKQNINKNIYLCIFTQIHRTVDIKYKQSFTETNSVLLNLKYKLKLFFISFSFRLKTTNLIVYSNRTTNNSLLTTK